MALRDGVYNQVHQGQLNLFLLHIVGVPGDPDDPGVIRLHSNVARFDQVLGAPPTQWDGEAFATSGDVIEGQHLTVHWDAGYFNQTTQVRRPSAAAAAVEFAGDPARHLAGPYGAADADSEPRRVRHAQLVPFQYARYFLTDRTPRWCVETLLPIIDAAGDTVPCAPFIDWLLCTATQHSVGGVNTGPVTGIEAPQPAHQDAALVRHRRRFITRDLRSLNPAAAAAGAQLIAQSVNSLAAAQNAQRAADEARRLSQRKTVDTMFGHSTQKLLRIGQVPNTAALQPIWRDLPSVPKNQHRLTLQHRLTEAGQMLAPFRTFVFPAHLVPAIINLEFSNPDPTDLTGGYHPFLLGSTLTSTAAREATQLAREFDMMVAGGTAPSHADTMKFMVSDERDVTFAMGHGGSKALLVNFRVHLCMLWGPVFTWVEGLLAFLNQYDARLHLMDFILLHDESNRPLLPVMIVRWVQLKWEAWVIAQEHSPTPLPCPNLLELFHKIDAGEFWVPALPPKYLTRVQRMMGAGPSTDADRPRDNRRGGEPEGSQSRDRSSGGDADQPQQQYVGNQNPDPRFEPYRSRGLTSREVRARAGASNPAPICPGWHVRGGCNTRCGMADTHRVATEEENVALVAWCDRHWVAPGGG